MSNDAANGPQDEKLNELPLTSLGVIGALARALQARTKKVIAPKADAPKIPLLKVFASSKHTDHIVEIAGQEVGRYKVNTTNDRFEVADPTAFEAFAEEKDEIDIVIVPKPAWVDAILKRAEQDPVTGDIFDSETGEVIPGLRFVPGGEPTGTVSFTWKKRNGREVGKEVLLAAWHRRELDDLLR
ncbi:hypothetical protein, partial [Streptomyces sp. CL12-4]|uniref:hypothetical protein n=1 Tax=Streptomyces sp. CL12-4 TaxID=2810306 RepID=UPI001EFC0F3A